MTREEVHARYQQVLVWHRQGRSFQEIGERWGVARQRAQDIYRNALHWEAATAVQQVRLSTESPVEALHVNQRVVVGLRRRGMTTVGQVVTMSDEDLLGVRNVGPDTVAAIRRDLAARYHTDP